MRLYCTILCLAARLCLASQDAGRELVLKDLNDVAHRPLDLDGKKVSVFIFFWQDCPISNSYAPELNRIAASQTNAAFYIVQVDPELTVTAAKEHAREFKLQIPVLLDPQHRLVRIAGATVTPEAVVFGGNGQILYRGRIDDSYAALGKKRATTQRHDLQDALDAISKGLTPKQKETKAIGCLMQ